jgi:chromate transporter
MHNIENKDSYWNKLWTLFITFLKIAAVTVGGGVAMLPMMEEEFVRKKKWIDSEDIVDVFAIVQSVPGIIAVNTAVYVGYRVAGLAGAIAAALGVVTPSYIVIVIIAAFMIQAGSLGWVNSAFTGIRAGVCALILVAVIGLGRKVLKSKFEWIIAGAAFIGIYMLGINVIWLILGAGVVGYMRYFLQKKHINAPKEESDA